MGTRSRRATRRRGYTPGLEILEDRTVPSGGLGGHRHTGLDDPPAARLGADVSGGYPLPPPGTPPLHGSAADGTGAVPTPVGGSTVGLVPVITPGGGTTGGTNTAASGTGSTTEPTNPPPTSTGTPPGRPATPAKPSGTAVAKK